MFKLCVKVVVDPQKHQKVSSNVKFEAVKAVITSELGASSAVLPVSCKWEWSLVEMDKNGRMDKRLLK